MIIFFILKWHQDDEVHLYMRNHIGIVEICSYFNTMYIQTEHTLGTTFLTLCVWGRGYIIFPESDTQKFSESKQKPVYLFFWTWKICIPSNDFIHVNISCWNLQGYDYLYFASSRSNNYFLEISETELFYKRKLHFQYNVVSLMRNLINNIQNVLTNIAFISKLIFYTKWCNGLLIFSLWISENLQP